MDLDNLQVSLHTMPEIIHWINAIAEGSAITIRKDELQDFKALSDVLKPMLKKPVRKCKDCRWFNWNQGHRVDYYGKKSRWGYWDSCDLYGKNPKARPNPTPCGYACGAFEEKSDG